MRSNPLQTANAIIHTDHLNTPRSITDQSGNEVWQWDNTEPFGDSVPNGDPNNTGNVFDMPLGFAGQYRDRETALFYNYRRDLDPGLGGYLQADPLVFTRPLSAKIGHLYAYVGSKLLMLLSIRLD